MKFEFITRFKCYPAAIALGLIAACSVLGLRGAGLLQLLELRTLDAMMERRPGEAKDQRVVVIGVSEADLNWLRSPALTDAVLAALITQIKHQQPRVIGLDFYRNLPIEPGSQALRELFRSTPNLIGIEKVIIDQNDDTQAPLPGNELLTAAHQVAASDVIVDADGRVRRAFLFPAAQGPRVLESLGFRLALDYLAQEGLVPDPNADPLQIGGAEFPPMLPSTGGYAQVHDGGYQILLNPRATVNPALVSLQDVLTGNLPPDLMRDRVVLIGSTALSSADVFYSGHSNAKDRNTQITFGIELHAELTSQIISHVLDDRPLTGSLSETLEMGLILLLAYSGIALQGSATPEWQRLLRVLGMSGGVAIASYASLSLWGLWLPLVPMMLSLWSASILMATSCMIQLRTLAERDGMTQLANRRTFDEALQQAWVKGLRSQQPVSLILCDVDHFKLYNDAYGHLQGDECLRHVAKSIRSAVKRSKDLAARYGGEEFVVLLPNTSAEAAFALAETIRQNVKSAQLPHKASKVADHVTLSLGVTCLVPSMEVPINSVVQFADLGLYRAKEGGRDRANLHLPQTGGIA
ncbi:MAG: diguanylate cyclase [Synechococcales cyanobacterium CRU_2_2]|nr:diguanylate cyclase [Synechococcales cyanobacterium CRU_2_2]